MLRDVVGSRAGEGAIPPTYTDMLGVIVMEASLEIRK